MVVLKIIIIFLLRHISHVKWTYYVMILKHLFLQNTGKEWH